MLRAIASRKHKNGQRNKLAHRCYAMPAENSKRVRVGYWRGARAGGKEACNDSRESEVMIGTLLFEDFGLLASRNCLDAEATLTESLRPKFHPHPRSRSGLLNVSTCKMQSSKGVA